MRQSPRGSAGQPAAYLQPLDPRFACLHHDDLRLNTLWRIKDAAVWKEVQQAAQAAAGGGIRHAPLQEEETRRRPRLRRKRQAEEELRRKQQAEELLGKRNQDEQQNLHPQQEERYSPDHDHKVPTGRLPKDWPDSGATFWTALAAVVCTAVL